jgi:hypothetical protein
MRLVSGGKSSTEFSLYLANRWKQTEVCATPIGKASITAAED